MRAAENIFVDMGGNDEQIRLLSLEDQKLQAVNAEDNAKMTPLALAAGAEMFSKSWTT